MHQSHPVNASTVQLQSHLVLCNSNPLTSMFLGDHFTHLIFAEGLTWCRKPTSRFVGCRLTSTCRGGNLTSRKSHGLGACTGKGIQPAIMDMLLIMQYSSTSRKCTHIRPNIPNNMNAKHGHAVWHALTHNAHKMQVHVRHNLETGSSSNVHNQRHIASSAAFTSYAVVLRCATMQLCYVVASLPWAV